jgi:RimJ/RimL family protein N-acetyltransferase
MSSSRNNGAMKPIESSGLCLEPLVSAHAEEMFEPLSAPAIYNYMPGQPPLSAAALRERYLQLERGRSADNRQRWLNWIVRLNSGECVGFVQATVYPGLTGDFAFVLAPEYWGRGVAFEACRAALPYLAHEIGVTALFATVDPQNSRSIRLLIRLGFSEVTPAQYPHGQVEPNDRVFSLSCCT